MFIASKFEDIYPIRMQHVFDKIGHKKFSIESLKSREADILKVLQFLIHVPNIYDFLKIYMRLIIN